MPLGPLGEHGHAREHVGARLEVGELLPVSPASPVAGASAAHPPIRDEQLRGSRLRQDRGATLLGALREPASQLRQRGDKVPVIPHRRRSRDRQSPPAGEEVDRLVLDPSEEWHLRRAHAPLEERAQRARVDDRAREQVRAGLLALLQHGHRDVAEPLGQLGLALQQLPEPDRAGEPGRAGADDQDPDFDLGLGRSRNELVRGERRRKVGRLHAALRWRTSSVSFGTISCRSPTIPRSAYSKIGAFGSLLIATIRLELCIPTLCWIAPEMPQAM